MRSDDWDSTEFEVGVLTKFWLMAKSQWLLYSSFIKEIFKIKSALKFHEFLKKHEFSKMQPECC